MLINPSKVVIAILLCAVGQHLPGGTLADSRGGSGAEVPATETAVSAYRHYFGITGGAIAILRNEEVIYRQLFGLANVELGAPVNSDTRFQLSSSSKLFTGTLMATLARDGIVDYSRPVREYLPGLPESWSDVLLEDIMSHVSGLPEVLDCNESNDRQAALRCVYALERPAQRRSQFGYNQTNYLLAAQVIETVTGASFGDVLLRRIFEPAGMSSAVLNGNSRDVVNNRATGYYPNEQGGIVIREYEFPSFLLSAAGMNATVDDMIGFAKTMSGDALLDAEWKSRMWQPPILANGKESHYALGWDLRELRDGTKSAGHEGGSLTTLRIYPSAQLTVIVLTNGMHKHFGLDGFADVLAQSVDTDILAPLDSAAYGSKVTYMASGIDAAAQLIESAYCDGNLNYQDCRELLVWLVQELDEDGHGEDAIVLKNRFGNRYDF